MVGSRVEITDSGTPSSGTHVWYIYNLSATFPEPTRIFIYVPLHTQLSPISYILPCIPKHADDVSARNPHLSNII